MTRPAGSVTTYSRSYSASPSGGTLTCASASMIAGMVFEWLTTSTTLPSDFDAIASSFRWAPGLEWQAPTGGTSSPIDWLLPPAIVLAIFAAGVAITKRTQRTSA